uniref:Annexin 4 n=1 Tax=Spironucleus vortens TaxID=58336 RepID=A0A142C672_SPIVO|nr:annexin 4 [Spironucleus vortens]
MPHNYHITFVNYKSLNFQKFSHHIMRGSHPSLKNLRLSVDPAKIDKLVVDIEEACKGLGTDEKRLINACAACSAMERGAVAAAYKAKTGKDLQDLLKAELSSNIKRLMQGMFTERYTFWAQELNESVKGLGTDETKLIDLIVSCGDEEYAAVDKVYTEKYGESVLAALTGDAGNSDWGKLLKLWIEKGDKCTKSAAEAAEALHKAGKGLGTDEKTFIQILGSVTHQQYAEIDAEFNKQFSKSLRDFIKAEFTGKDEYGFLAVHDYLLDPIGHIATMLQTAMKGAGTNEDRLVCTTVLHSDWVKTLIRGVYEKRGFGDLTKAIKGDTSGDLEYALLAFWDVTAVTQTKQPTQQNTTNKGDAAVAGPADKKDDNRHSESKETAQAERKKEEVSYPCPPYTTRFSSYNVGLLSLPPNHMQVMNQNITAQQAQDKKNATTFQDAKITAYRELRKTTIPAGNGQDKRDHLLYIDGIAISNDLDAAYFYRHPSGRILQGSATNLLNQNVPIAQFYKMQTESGAGQKLRLNNREYVFAESLVDPNHATVDMLVCVEDGAAPGETRVNAQYEVMVSKYNYTLYIAYKQENPAKDSESYRTRIAEVRYLLLKLENLIAQQCALPDIFLTKAQEPLQFAQLVNGTAFFKNALKCFLCCPLADLQQLHAATDRFENVAFAFILRDFDFGNEADLAALKAVECFPLVNLVYDEPGPGSVLRHEGLASNSCITWCGGEAAFHKSLDEAAAALAFPVKYRPARAERMVLEPQLVKVRSGDAARAVLVNLQLGGNCFRVLKPKRQGLDSREFVINQSKTTYVILTKSVKDYPRHHLFGSFGQTVFIQIVKEEGAPLIQLFPNLFFVKQEKEGEMKLVEDAYVQFGDQLDVYSCAGDDLFNYIRDFQVYVKLFNKQVDITSVKTYKNLRTKDVNGFFMLEFNNFKENSNPDKPIVRHDDSVFFYGLQLARQQGKELVKDFETVFIQIPAFVVQNPDYAQYYAQLKKNLVAMSAKMTNYNFIVYVDDESPITGYEDILILKPDRQFRVIAVRAGIYGKTLHFDKQENGFCKLNHVIETIPQTYEDFIQSH